MGKNLNNGRLVARPQKLAFYKLPSGAFQRMEGFTDLGYSQNPKEYSRQYVDEDFERTDVVGYAPSISYSFDRYTGNRVLSDIVKITENELIGEQMRRTIVTVDISDEVTSGYGNAKMRDYSVIPDANGDSTDCLTYSGTFKARGALVDCVATSADDWQTIMVTTDLEHSASATVAVVSEGGAEAISNDNGGTNIVGEIAKNSPFTITVTADFAGAQLTIFRVTNGYPVRISEGVGELEYVENSPLGTLKYMITAVAGGKSTSYTVELTAVE